MLDDRLTRSGDRCLRKSSSAAPHRRGARCSRRATVLIVHCNQWNWFPCDCRFTCHRSRAFRVHGFCQPAGSINSSSPFRCHSDTWLGITPPLRMVTPYAGVRRFSLSIVPSPGEAKRCHVAMTAEPPPAGRPCFGRRRGHNDDEPCLLQRHDVGGGGQQGGHEHG